MICDMCKKEIDEKKERYVHVEDWEKKKKTKELWMHLACFNKSMNRELTELEKAAKAMLGKATRVYNNLPDELKGSEEFALC